MELNSEPQASAAGLEIVRTIPMGSKFKIQTILLQWREDKTSLKEEVEKVKTELVSESVEDGQ